MGRRLSLFGVFFCLLLSLGLSAGPGRFLDVIVVLDSKAAPGSHAANQTAAARIAASLGVRARHTYGTALFGFAGRIPEGRLNGLRRDPRVAYVEIDRPVSIPIPRTAKKPNCEVDPSHPSCSGGGGDTGQEIPWGIVRVGADLNSNEGAGIHVFVIDTGIDVDHPDLSVSLNGFAAEVCRAKSCGQAWDDDNGHGTHVSGTIGALDNSEGVLGVASQVTLHAVKVLNKRGSGSFAGVIAGVDWVANQTATLGVATVANMSLGASGSKVGTCTASGFTIAAGKSDSFHEALCNAKNVGVVFAVAAGNSGADAERAVPAAYDDAVIAVSATKQGDDWPNWSNWGDNSAAWTGNNSAPVAIAAPGVSILSTWRNGGTNTISGTSMASPHVAGACALRLASNPQIANGDAFDDVRSFLLGAAEGAGSFSNTSGRPHAEDFLDASGL